MSLSPTAPNDRWFFWNRRGDMDDRLKELAAFVRETNKIEGITRTPNKREMTAHAELLSKTTLTIADMQLFVTAVQPGAVLRTGAGMNVRVGAHRPPPGGDHILQAFDQLLGSIDPGVSPRVSAPTSSTTSTRRCTRSWTATADQDALCGCG
jgi:hypothetical protein